MGSTKRIIAMLVFGLGLLLPAAAAAAAPQYVALGDSYSSGVGTRVFYEESGECDRSPDAYGPKIAAAKGYSLNFEACGGAKTPEVNSKQLGHLSATTSLVTITIGGNDAGFSNVIINCALYYFTCGSAISEANEFIKNKLPGCWKRPTKTSARRPRPRKSSCWATRSCSRPKARPATSTSSPRATRRK